MRTRAILLAVLASSLLLVAGAGAVAANGDHDHGESDDGDGGMPDWVPDVVADLLKSIGDLVGGTVSTSTGVGPIASSGQ